MAIYIFIYYFISFLLVTYYIFISFHFSYILRILLVDPKLWDQGTLRPKSYMG